VILWPEDLVPITSFDFSIDIFRPQSDLADIDAGTSSAATAGSLCADRLAKANKCDEHDECAHQQTSLRFHYLFLTFSSSRFVVSSDH
jgi:hypothetical protein